MSVEIKAVSSLEKVFSDLCPDCAELQNISLLSGERANLQFVIKSSSDCTADIKITSGLHFSAYHVKEIPAKFTIEDDRGSSAVLRDARPGNYPDLLDAFSDKAELKAGEYYTVWAEINAESNAGEHKISLCATPSDGKPETATVMINVIPARLPEQKLIHINWFHSDCLASYYKTEVFSEEYWRITENFVKSAAAHGVNCLLTPIFTPPLDTAVGGERPTVQLVDVYKKQYEYTFSFEKLDRWIDMAVRCGIKYFELSHLFTQWGARQAPKIIAQTSKGSKQIFGWLTVASSQGYRSFLRQFSAALISYTDKKGITDKCFIHTSDEPDRKCIRSYSKAAAVIKEYFGCYEHIDALSDAEFYKRGLVETPIPGEQDIENFRNIVPKLWTYYCCGQYKDNLPNRFMCMPSIRNRILGVLLYKYNCTGFLQWGFNFYYTQYSKRLVDPFTETDAGGKFPSGDSFIVYPGSGGVPVPSLRQKVFYDGIEDISALNLLSELTSRENVLNIINEYLGDISFTSYPLENSEFLRFREKINDEIAQNIEK